MSVIKKAILWGIAFLLFIDVHGCHTNDGVDTRELCKYPRLIPDCHCKQTDDDKATQGGRKQKLSPHPLATANKLRVVMIKIALRVDIAYQPDLFTWLAVRCKEATPVNVLVKQRVTVTQNQQ
ncbi:hypothetical protein RC96_07635 [Pectobacterium carotovorum subsp. carotovorum]|nr:hypothetical protein RC96_07635 [Pectobacterium carotovorum subsp. carotovorum]KHT24846.1 hypothetical protein RC98_18680 [Pectobacterium carotovorum subsp. carotovorum]KHT29074.1 hypothetical protein RD01_19705 [Pectobacterium carotovorum subsp. carotovorum]KHT30338.1 hypothetical protein RC99_16440 [Pectobacterium carotovorum subsp. carotovorum]